MVSRSDAVCCHHCSLHPGDLFPFTRKPLFIIVDSSNSASFKVDRPALLFTLWRQPDLLGPVTLSCAIFVHVFCTPQCYKTVHFHCPSTVLWVACCDALGFLRPGSTSSSGFLGARCSPTVRLSLSSCCDVTLIISVNNSMTGSDCRAASANQLCHVLLFLAELYKSVWSASCVPPLTCSVSQECSGWVCDTYIYVYMCVAAVQRWKNLAEMVLTE